MPTPSMCSVLADSCVIQSVVPMRFSCFVISTWLGEGSRTVQFGCCGVKSPSGGGAALRTAFRLSQKTAEIPQIDIYRADQPERTSFVSTLYLLTPNAPDFADQQPPLTRSLRFQSVSRVLLSQAAELRGWAPWHLRKQK